MVVRRPLGAAFTPWIVAERRAELTLAWPTLRARASLALWQAVREGGATSAPPKETAMGAVPSFAAWQALPVAERWARYTSDEWRGVRRATRITGGILLVGMLLGGGRLIGWPLARGGWFVAASGTGDAPAWGTPISSSVGQGGTRWRSPRKSSTSTCCSSRRPGPGRRAA